MEGQKEKPDFYSQKHDFLWLIGVQPGAEGLGALSTGEGCEGVAAMLSRGGWLSGRLGPRKSETEQGVGTPLDVRGKTSRYV